MGKDRNCIIKGCTNKKSQGNFVGDICCPCYEMLTTGIIQPSTNFIFKKKEQIVRTVKETMFALVKDLNPDLSNDKTNLIIQEWVDLVKKDI